jgi:hypothetical protein
MKSEGGGGMSRDRDSHFPSVIYIYLHTPISVARVAKKIKAIMGVIGGMGGSMGSGSCFRIHVLKNKKGGGVGI